MYYNTNTSLCLALSLLAHHVMFVLLVENFNKKLLTTIDYIFVKLRIVNSDGNIMVETGLLGLISLHILVNISLDTRPSISLKLT